MAGSVLLALAAFTASRLFHMIHHGAAHQATPAEMAVAAVAFLCASGGAVLVSLGIHVFDKVAVSARWASPGKSDR